jgi:surface protein
METKVATLEYLKLQLENTILPYVLTNIILKYNEPSIKVEFNTNQILYLDQYEFENFDCKDIICLNIYGVLVLINPIGKFLNSIIEVIIGDVILVGNVKKMFHNTTYFNLDNDPSSSISKWDVSRVTNMRSMFFYSYLNADLSNWDTSNVTDMSYMFCNASKFNSDLSNWKTGNVTDMRRMFSGAIDFDSDLSFWDKSQVTNIDNMFAFATKYNSKRY